MSKGKEQRGRKVLRWVLGFVFIGAGITHFLATDTYARIVPPFLPQKEGLVYISGVFEFLGGLGLLIPRTQRLAAWGLIALLVAVFPANVYHALAKDGESIAISPLYHLIRLPFQGVLIWLVGVAAQLWNREDGGTTKNPR